VTIAVSGMREERDMSLIVLILALVVVGVLLWLLNNYVPMDSKIKTIINVVVVIWLLQAFGVLGSLRDVRIQ
jgi:hypothetical protein